MQRLRVSLAVGLLAVSACGAEPALPAADYFATVEEELARLDQATRDLTDRYATEAENELEALIEGADMADSDVAEQLRLQLAVIARSKAQSIIAAHTQQLRVFADRVGNLAPPDPVKAAHRELVDAMAAWAETDGATAELIAAAVDISDVGVAISGSPYADAQMRVDAACRSLEPNAAAVGIELTCPGTRLDVLQVTP